jgi:tRNA-dihydrouridine synthase
VPVLISGGLRTPEAVREAFAQTGAAGVLLARGSLGNPWLFEQVLGRREDAPSPHEILAELDWVIEGAVEHLGPERAARYLRKFYPWYVERLELGRDVQDALQRVASVEQAREVVREAALVAASTQ